MGVVRAVGPAAQQVLQRGPLPRIYPPSFALQALIERSVGPLLFNTGCTSAPSNNVTWAVSYLVISKRVHDHRLNMSTS